MHQNKAFLPKFNPWKWGLSLYTSNALTRTNHNNDGHNLLVYRALTLMVVRQKSAII
jgi:hypothetical protein